MEGLSKTDEVLALLSKRERSQGQESVTKVEDEETLGFTDFLPSPAAAVLNKLQRVSAQPRSEQPSSIGRTPSDALKVVLGEQQPAEPRTLRFAALSITAASCCQSKPCNSATMRDFMHACECCINTPSPVALAELCQGAGDPQPASKESCLVTSNNKDIKMI